jgi:hypothetical protein
MSELEQIIKKIPDKRKSALPKHKRAEVIQELAQGKSVRKTAIDLGIARKTAETIRIENKPLIAEIQEKQAIQAVEIKQRLLNKTLNLLDRKLDRIEQDDSKLDYMKPQELTSTAKDLFNMSQVELGKDTTDYTKKDIATLTNELKTITYAIEANNTRELLQLTFNDKDDN